MRSAFPSLVPLLLALALSLGGCISVNYQRFSQFEPVDEFALSEIQTPGTDLQTCLDALGAPLFVRETPHGVVLAYGWQDAGRWGFDVSITFERVIRVSFDYNQIDEQLRGVVLLFDSDWKLIALRRGFLRDLTGQLERRRPAVVDA